MAATNSDKRMDGIMGVGNDEWQMNEEVLGEGNNQRAGGGESLR